MGVYINMEKPKSCGECRLESAQYVNNYCRRTFCSLGADYEHCPLIEIDLEKDIPTIWYNRQTGRYEPKGTKQEVYERLYKLKNGERRNE